MPDVQNVALDLALRPYPGYVFIKGLITLLAW